jgi:hypothetical protein
MKPGMLSKLRVNVSHLKRGEYIIFIRKYTKKRFVYLDVLSKHGLSTISEFYESDFIEDFLT